MKYIPGYKLIYMISKDGVVHKVAGAKAGRVMKQQTNRQGYKSVRLTDYNSVSKQWRIHRLVALTYLPQPSENQDQVNHKDGRKDNNNLSNLEWSSQRENMQHAKDFGLIKRGSERSDKQRKQDKVNGYTQGKKNRKITPDIAAKMNELYDNGMTLTQVAKHMGYGFTSVQRYVNNIRSEAGRFQKG